MFFALVLISARSKSENRTNAAIDCNSVSLLLANPRGRTQTKKKKKKKSASRPPEYRRYLGDASKPPLALRISYVFPRGFLSKRKTAHSPSVAAQAIVCLESFHSFTPFSFSTVSHCLSYFVHPLRRLEKAK